MKLSQLDCFCVITASRSRRETCSAPSKRIFRTIARLPSATAISRSENSGCPGTGTNFHVTFALGKKSLRYLSRTVCARSPR